MISPRRVWILNPRRGGVFLWSLRYFVYASLCLAPLLVFTGWSTFVYFSERVPEVAKVQGYAQQAPGITRIYGSQGALLAEVAREHRAYTSLDQIPPTLVQAFLAAEDRRFYGHQGLDFRGLARAMVANVRSGTIVQGGSTITQQVAKSFLQDRQRTLSRKAVEAILALKIESTLGKDAILETYLNKIFLGNQAYGVAAAAERYFAKDLKQLSLSESAMIAGLARAPSRFNPITHPERAVARRDVVLHDMFEAGYIDEAQEAKAKRQTLHTARPIDPFRIRAPYFAEASRREVQEKFGKEALLHDGLRIETAVDLRLQDLARRSVDRSVRALDRRHGWSGPVAHLTDKASKVEFLRRSSKRYDKEPWQGPTARWRLALVDDVVRQKAKLSVGSQRAVLPLRAARWAAPYNRHSGVNGQTVADLRKVLQAGDVVWVKVVGERKRMEDPLRVRLGQDPRVQAAIWTQRHDWGYVQAIAGGVDYDRSQFNRAIQACRQPGSVFKAIYYALALDGNEFQGDSVLEARPWQAKDDEEWNPRNIGKTIDGKVLLRTALIKSLNTPSIRLFVSLGAAAVVRWSRRLGIESPLIQDKGLSLGASCVRHREIAKAFSIFVRGGLKRESHMIKRIVDKYGKVRLDARHWRDPALSTGDRLDAAMSEVIDAPAQVIRESTAFLITRLLREVVTHGIAMSAQKAGVPVGGKSGSASGRFRRKRGVQDLTTDTWFVGFSSRNTTSAWMGFDNAQERSMGDEEASYTTAIPLWADFMKGVVGEDAKLHGPLPRRKVPGLSSRRVDARRGGPAIPGKMSAEIFHRKGVPAPAPADPIDIVDFEDL